MNAEPDMPYSEWLAGISAVTATEIAAASDRSLQRALMGYREALVQGRRTLRCNLTPATRAEVAESQNALARLLGLIVVERYCRRWKPQLVDMAAWSAGAWEELQP
jgi:hypothetical protein